MCFYCPLFLTINKEILIILSTLYFVTFDFRDYIYIYIMSLFILFKCLCSLLPWNPAVGPTVAAAGAVPSA